MVVENGRLLFFTIRFTCCIRASRRRITKYRDSLLSCFVFLKKGGCRSREHFHLRELSSFGNIFI